MELWRRATRLEIYEGYGMSEIADQRHDRGVRSPARLGRQARAWPVVQIVDLHTGLAATARPSEVRVAART